MAGPPLAYNNQTIVVDYGNGMMPQHVVLNGFVAISQQGVANGSITATFSDGSNASLQYNNSDVSIATGNLTLDLNVNGAGNSFLLNGNLVPVGGVLDSFLNDFSSGGGPASWNGSSTALLGLVAVNQTAQMQNNFLGAQALGAAAPGWFCKALGVTFAVACAALAFAGCNAIAAACGAATTITVGGSLIVCAELITACYAGLVATPALAYLWYISNVWST